MNNENRSQQIDRRGFLKASGALAAGMAVAGLAGSSRAFGQQTTGEPKTEKLALGVPNAEKLGWRVGIQVYTFHKFTLFEAIDMTASLGLKYIETCPGMRISKDNSGSIGSWMSADQRKVVKQKMADAGLKYTSHYEGLGKSARKVLEFCKDMGLEMLITDPPRVAKGDGSIDAYEKLCEEYGVQIALTNHPKPAAYWNPDLVMEDCRGRSKWVGASADFGHFMRGGFAPMDVVKKYLDAGRMYQFHFRDVNKVGRDGRDVSLGEGAADIRGILTELHQRKVKPLFSIEYESNFDKPMVEMVPSVKFFNDVCGELLAKG